MSIIRVSKRERFTVVEKTMTEDPSLSWQAKGMLTYLLGKPDGWKVQASDLTAKSTNGRDANYAILKELIDAGYIDRIQARDENGRVKGYEYIVHESRAREEDSPLPGNPDTVSPDTEKPDISNKGIKQIKKEMADYVFLTESEYGKLDELLGNDRERYFLRFASWISTKNPSYQKKRSAYLTILSWYQDDQAKKPAPKPAPIMNFGSDAPPRHFDPIVWE